MRELQEFLLQDTTVLSSALIAAIVAGLVNYLFRLSETRYRLEAEYRYEQRKKLRDVIARFHGRFLIYANSLSQRFWNLYENHHNQWLHVSGGWKRGNYYFMSFTFRFLNLLSLLRQFEKEAIFIDVRIAKRTDFIISSYVGAIRSCMTDVSLFRGVVYDTSSATDHFFADVLRSFCDRHFESEGKELSYDEYLECAESDDFPDDVFRFFDGLSKGEGRFRWDRLVALHVLLVCFINHIGLDHQKAKIRGLMSIVGSFENVEIRDNFPNWLERHGLPKFDLFRIRLAIFLACYMKRGRLGW